jgi:hypothetical protein
MQGDDYRIQDELSTFSLAIKGYSDHGLVVVSGLFKPNAPHSQASSFASVVDDRDFILSLSYCTWLGGGHKSLRTWGNLTSVSLGLAC